MIDYCPSCGMRALVSREYGYLCLNCNLKFNIMARGDIPD